MRLKMQQTGVATAAEGSADWLKSLTLLKQQRTSNSGLTTGLMKSSSSRLTVPKEHQGDVAVNNWIAAMLSVYKRMTGK